MKSNSFNVDNIKHRCDELGLVYINHYVEKDQKNKHRYYVQFICKKHPTVGVQINEWSHFIRSKYSCRICSGKYKNTSEFILGNPQINGNVNILSEYNGFNNPLQCECNICKHTWTTTPHSLKNGSGCPKCGRRNAGLSKRMSHDEYVAKVYTNNPHIEVISQYLTLKDPVVCQCKIDGVIFTVSQADNLLYENVQCPYCSTSKSEQLIVDILNKYNYDYKFHYRFDDCKYIHTLEFDFAIFDNNNLLCLVEYDGEQHYKPVDFAGKGELWALQQLHITQQRDKIKTDYCLQNNIPLIRIPYWERKNLEHYLLSQIDNVCNIAV